jgi:hypothetical protein
LPPNNRDRRFWKLAWHPMNDGGVHAAALERTHGGVLDAAE